MTFPDNIVEEAWKRATGKCECRRSMHRHGDVRCYKELVFQNRGPEGDGRWETHHVSASGGDVLTNCEILCWACHRETP